jgi:hypothetical protein
LNGVIALQFVQTETLMDMVESAGLYEQTALKQFKFYEHVLSPDKVQKAKRNVIASALDLSADDAGKFWPVYEKYEEEKDAALGEGYDIFSLYAGEASDFTPALAKRLGYDLLHITERELKLKEKFYLEMEKAVGPSVATRFLAWEDYHSLITKMHVWAEAN